MIERKSGTFGTALGRGLLVLTLLFVTFGIAQPAFAQSGDRSLYLYYTHTKETARITFRRNGRYDQAGLRQLNRFLRDWRRDEATEMDPALFDLIWSVYQEVGASQPVHIVSAYRSPATNDMLRSRSSGVAQNSQHTRGNAIDFYIPGVPISRLRQVAMKHQVGGVGYYPTSGSPFVHLDTGNVRAWPRMTRAQLRELFPDGRTLHLPSEGDTPLSQEGRRYAMAEWQRCQSVPCVNGTANTQVTRGGSGSGRTLLDLLFGGGNSDEVDAVQVASNEPQRRSVNSVPVPTVAPVPATRTFVSTDPDPGPVPVPAEMPETVMVAMLGLDPLTDEPVADQPPMPADVQADETAAGETDTFAVASIGIDNAPTPRALLARDDQDLPVVSAYAPTATPEPDAQRALQQLIERRDSDDAGLRGGFETAALGGAPQISLDDAANLFASTWNAVAGARTTDTDPATGVAAPAYDLVNVQARTVQLTAPDFEHVADAMAAPVALTDARFAVMFEPGQGDLSPDTELGVHCARMTFTRNPDGTPPAHRFAAQQPIFVASL